MPNALVYIRYSSEPQGAGDSRRRQTELAKTTAKLRGLTITEWIEDLGVSAYRGLHVEIGNLGKLLDRAREGKLEKGTYLLFENFDRLSRLHVFESTRVILDLYEAGLTLITTADNTLHDRDQGLLGLLRPMMEGERAHGESARKADLLQKTWAAKRTRASLGDTKMTSICPAWLTPVKDSKGKIVEFERNIERSVIVQRIFRESANGIGKFSIAVRLNSDKISPWRGKNGWHSSYVQKILTNRAVIGEFQPHRKVEREFEPRVSRRVGGKRVPEGDVIYGYYPAVIDLSLWERTRAARAERRGKGGRKGKRLANLLSGLCRCGECHSTMTYRSPGAQYGRDYLICDKALRKLGCSSTSHYLYQPIEAAVLTYLDDLLFDPANLDGEEIIAAENDLVALSEKRSAKETEIGRLVEAIASGDNPYVGAAIEQRTEEIAEIKVKESAAKRRLEEVRGMLETSERQAAMDGIRADLTSDDGAIRYAARSRLSQELTSVITEVTFEPYDSGHIVISVAHGLRMYDIKDGKLVALISEDIWPNLDNLAEGDNAKGNDIVRMIQRIARIKKIDPQDVVLEIFRQAFATAGKDGSGSVIKFPLAAWRFLVSQYPELKGKVSLPERQE